MKQYGIQISPEAAKDIERVYIYIAYEILAPQTAVEYYMGIFRTIRRLSTVGASFAVSQNFSL
ncbi:MAG: hypothetical protein LBR67_07135 [Dysgonamonadaceae bacterium]|jgi:hypothetical protein|nr:hypothetical protein [Dysgonamonadaceae bacterium]